MLNQVYDGCIFRRSTFLAANLAAFDGEVLSPPKRRSRLAPGAGWKASSDRMKEVQS
jgi:hypothetical protein